MLADAIAAELPEMRRQAESLMTLTLTAYEPTAPTQDADGFDIPSFIDRGTVCGKVQGSTSQGKDTNTRYIRIGEVERPVLEGGLHIPLDADVPKAGEQRGENGGWEYEVTDVCGSADPALLGRRYLVVKVPAKSFATARRLSVISLD